MSNSFHQSLEEGHDQEDNVSTDGGVTSDIESDVSNTIIVHVSQYDF